MMNHCCSSSQGHVMGTCTCGMFQNQTNPYSMLYSMPNHKPYEDDYEYEAYPFTPSSSSSSSYSPVDCTLSLGTPSTRLTEDEEKRSRHERRSSLSNFSWNSSQSKPNSQSQTKSSRGSNSGNFNNDPLLARRCANCDTTSTPLWRNGPRGPKSLCNACGIRYKKEERRAKAAAATSAAVTNGVTDYGHHNNSWYGHQQSQMFGNELRFVEDSDGDSENGNPFMSWRLNVADRTSLVHDFTR